MPLEHGEIYLIKKIMTSLDVFRNNPSRTCHQTSWPKGYPDDADINSESENETSNWNKSHLIERIAEKEGVLVNKPV